jgi:hypothetical protein
VTPTPLERLSWRGDQVRAAFCGGADPDWLAAIERGKFRPEPSIRLPEFTPPTPEQRIADYLDEALSRAEAWCSWHAGRAERRGLPASADATSRAACILGSLQGRPSASWLAARVYDAVLGVTEQEFASFGFHVIALDHMREWETSDIRILVNVTIRSIAGLRRQLGEGYLSGAEAQLAAAEELVFAPGYPPQEPGYGN